MSSRLAIGAVSAVLRNLLDDAMINVNPDLGTTVDVSAVAPDTIDLENDQAAPRLNLSSAKEPAQQQVVSAPQLQSLWMQAVRHVLSNTEDVGERFAEEARRIHYGEADQRGIRGKASREDTEALLEEGIEVMPLPIPVGLDGPVQ